MILEYICIYLNGFSTIENWFTISESMYEIPLVFNNTGIK